jgi:PEP-CTERM motif
MIRSLKFFSAAASLICVLKTGNVRATILYNPIVTTIGNGGQALSSSGQETNINLYYNSVAGQTSPVSTVQYNAGATGTRLVTSGTATSEGTLSNNPAISNAAAQGLPYSGVAYAYSAGYDQQARAGSGAVNSQGTPRTVGSVTVGPLSVSNATVQASQVNANAYTGNNIRSATGDDANTKYFTAGTGTNAAWRYFNDGGTSTQLNTTTTNTRTVEILNGQLFGSSSSGSAVGITAIGTGVPTTNPQTENLLFATGTSSTASPYEFVLIDNPNGQTPTAASYGFNTAYIADDGTGSSEAAGNAGIEKWVLGSTGSWTKAYTLLNTGDTGYRGLAGQLDSSTDQVVLWTTNASGTSLEQVTDTGAGATFTTLATAPTNEVFRGVALSPVPEPSTLVLAGLSLIGLSASARRLRKRV